MFFGSVPGAVRSVIDEQVRDWRAEHVWVGCSGNFTIERVLARHGRFRLVGNDVTIYSCALGAYFAGEDFPVSLKPEYAEEWGVLADYLQDAESVAATILVLSQIAVGLNKDNAYYRRVKGGVRRQWPALHARTVARLRALDLRLAGFWRGGVLEMMDSVPEEAGVIAYPPFFSGDYENMYANLDRMFDWPAPAYRELNAALVDELIDRIIDRSEWMVGVNRRLPALEAHLRGIAQTVNRGVPIYIYASGGKARVALPRQEVAPVLAPRLAGEIGDHLAIAELTGPQFSALRSQYMNEHIVPGQPSFACAVLVDGQVAGAFAYSTAPSQSHWEGRIALPYAYLLSDFPVRPTRYRHLAKLVLYAALSKEARLLCERYGRKRMRSAVTTAYTDHPVSMKYRGLFDLLTRKEQAPDGSAGNSGKRYQLNYGAPLGEWTLAEGLALWKKKYGKAVHDETTALPSSAVAGEARRDRPDHGWARP